MRYAERIASPSTAEDSATAKIHNGASNENDASSDAAYSVISREQKLKIVGVSDLDPDSMRGAARARVFLPLKLAQDLHVMQPSDLRDNMRGFNKQPSYSTISVRVKNPKQVEAVEQAIKKLGFNTFSILDATRSLRQFFAVLDLFLGIFGSLALAVASIGIVNTLVMAILERRREIGIMKAIGASDGDVKKLFFAEAGAMGVLGGIVGVVLGWTIGHVINLGTNIYLKRQALPPGKFLVGAVVAGGRGHRFCFRRQPGFRPVSRRPAPLASIPCRRCATSKLKFMDCGSVNSAFDEGVILSVRRIRVERVRSCPRRGRRHARSFESQALRMTPGEGFS